MTILSCGTTPVPISGRNLHLARAPPQSQLAHFHCTRRHTIKDNMPSRPEMRIKSAKYAKNIDKRGRVGPLTSRREQKSTLGPVIILGLLAVLVGSLLIQIFRGQLF